MKFRIGFVMLLFASVGLAQTTYQSTVATGAQMDTTFARAGRYLTKGGVTMKYPSRITAGGTGVTYWITNIQTAETWSTSGVGTNGVIRAVPWIPDADALIDSANIEVSTAQAGGVVWGLYDNQSDSTLYPGALLFSKYDTTSIGVKAKSLAGANMVQLRGGHVYWMAWCGNTTASFRNGNVRSTSAILGGPAAVGASGPYTGISASRAMDWTLPNPFTAGAAPLAGFYPAVTVFRVH